LRWHNGPWKGDALLTEVSQERLPEWFKDNGCPYLQQLRDDELARRRKDAEEEARFVGFFPRKIVEALDDPVETAVCVCKALGSVDMTWGTTTNKERDALAAMRNVDGQSFLAALEQLGNDRGGLRGAARLFFYEGYHERMLAAERTKWLVRLAEVVLGDGLDDDKPSLLRFLTRERDPAVRALLHEVFTGKLGKEIDLKKAFGQEPGLRTGAALALVRMGDDSLAPDVKKMLPRVEAKADVAALEVCLALLGDAQYVKTEHFRLQSYSIGFAALKAVERHRDNRALEALVKGALHHPWAAVQDEDLKSFERIVGKKMSSGEVEDWWEVHHEGNDKRPIPIFTWKYSEKQPPRCVAFSPDGRLVAAGGHDHTVVLWDARTGKEVQTLRGHAGSVHDVAFHPERNRLASSSSDQTVRIWDLTTGQVVRTLRGHQGMVLRVRYSPDGKRLVSAGDSTVRFWDAGTGTELLSFATPGRGDICFAFHPDGKELALGCRRGDVQIRDAATGQVGRAWQGHGTGIIDAVAWSPDGKFLVTGGADKAVRIWDATTGKMVRDLRGHRDLVCGVAIGPGGKTIASASWDKYAIIWDVARGKQMVSFKVHPESVCGLAISPDGKRLATAGEDKTIRVWDLEQALAVKR
jgi:WD40 repeat protein